jgi:phosphomannomutase
MQSWMVDWSSGRQVSEGEQPGPAEQSPLASSGSPLFRVNSTRPMGSGSLYMNELTVIQTTQGLLRYLQYDLQHSMSPLAVPRGGWQLQAEDTPFSPSKDDCAAGAQLLRQRGVCIGYDHRQRGTLSSETFALLTAAVFLSQGVGPHTTC